MAFFILFVTILDNASAKVVEYMCNSDGLRVKKVATSTGTTDYTLHGKNVVHMTNGSNSLHFYYDAQNGPAVVEFNWVPYAYVHNLQGDIIAIVDANGNKVVEYKYDAWGKPLSKTGSMANTLGTLNPFRYRGYVYDEETGLYYLRSRYYAPNRCRFMCIDKIIAPGIHEANLFAYCKNIPSMAKDPDGYSGILGTLSAIAAGVSIAYAREIISATADSFLSERGWTLTNMLFQQGLWGSGSPVTDETYGIQQVKDLIAADSQTYEMIEKVLEGMEPGTTIEYKPDSGFEYEKGDMYYALQHVDCIANITKHSDGSWNASINITDTYNFDNIRWGISLGDVANNGGLFLQGIGMMKPYKIDITVELSSK